MIDVLKKGKMVANPVFWKHIQNVMIAIATVLPAVVIYYPDIQLDVSLEKLSALAGACGGIATYLTYATTDKLGL